RYPDFGSCVARVLRRLDEHGLKQHGETSFRTRLNLAPHRTRARVAARRSWAGPTEGETLCLRDHAVTDETAVGGAARSAAAPRAAAPHEAAVTLDRGVVDEIRRVARGIE